MNGILEAGLVVSLIIFLLAIDLMVWSIGAIFLLAMLGWHSPGWIVTPVAHAANTALAVVGGVLAIATPVLLDLAIKRLM